MRFLSSFAQSPDGLLWDPDPAAGATAVADPAATTTTTPAATTTPATTTPAKFSYDEDRSTWVNPQKFRAAEAATNAATRARDDLQRQLAEAQGRVAALAGVTPQDPSRAEADKVIADFYALFPHLKELDADTIKDIKAIRSQQGEVTAATRQVWDDRAEQFLGVMDQRFAEKFNVDKLSPKQQRAIRAAFGATVPDPKTDPDAHADFERRYKAGDETLIDEFLRDYDAEVLEPVRRSALVPAVTRRAVPRSGSSAPVIATEPQPKPTGDPGKAADRYVEVLKQIRQGGIPA